MSPADGGGKILVEDGLLSAGFVQLPILLARDPNLSAGAKLVYVALLWYHWRGQDYPGQHQLAEDFGFSERSCRTYLQELEREGYLESSRPGRGQPNTLTLRTLRPAKFAGLDRQLLPVSIQGQDSVLRLTESDTPRQDPEGQSQTTGARSDSDSLRTWAESTATALGRPGEAKQLATWVRKQQIPLEILQAAGEVTAQQRELTKPVAYLQTVAKVMLADRAAAAEAGERKRADRKRDALGYARQVYADPIIGGSWASVESIVGESYGTALAAEVVKELQR